MDSIDAPASKPVPTGSVASLIIRFEQDGRGQLRGYVIDVPAGRPHAFIGSDQLHDLIDRLVDEHTP